VEAKAARTKADLLALFELAGLEASGELKKPLKAIATVFSSQNAAEIFAELRSKRAPSWRRYYNLTRSLLHLGRASSCTTSVPASVSR
jgi:hypothetical protein